MKRIFFILAALAVTFSLSAQQVGYDVQTMDLTSVTGGDTLIVPVFDNINNCFNNSVTIRFCIQNTDAVTDTFNLGGIDNNVTLDISTGAEPYFETIASSALPIIVDTTAISPASGGFTRVNGWYCKSVTKDNFQFRYPAVYVSKSALSQGDIRVYFYNIKDR